MDPVFGSPDAARAAAMKPPAAPAASAPELELGEYIRGIANSGPEAIKILSTRLAQTPYYRGKAVTKLTPSLVKALENMEEARAMLRDYRGDIPRELFLVESIGEAGSGASGGPTSTVQTRVSTKLEGRTLINKIFEDLLGRGPTKAEFDKYYTQVTKRQKAMPTTTTYSGGKRNVVTQTGGPDVEEFLFQKIAGTDEAKSKKVFGFYDIFKQALGVD
jgi:hypothetical protein